MTSHQWICQFGGVHSETKKHICTKLRLFFLVNANTQGGGGAMASKLLLRKLSTPQVACERTDHQAT
jgi:hypothetical protein